MKIKQGFALLLIAFLITSCSPALPTATPAAVETETSVAETAITVLFEESSEVLINPGKGWVLYYPYEDRPQEVWDVVSVCYSRLEWNWIEPSEGNYDWSVIDNAVAACSAHGKPFAFGIMAANSSSGSETVTPAWVFTAGAQTGVTYTGSNGNTLTAPVWNDPVYLEKMQALIDALVERYDGDPNIAFIDARNCGDFGEWHSLGCSELSDADKAILVDQWKGFSKTTIVVPTNSDSAEYPAQYAVDTYGFGIRRDSSETDQNAAGYAYDKSPAVSEWSGGYESLKSCGTWSGVCWSADLVESYMKASKFSYDNLGQWGSDATTFLSENPDLVAKWANRMGYWLKLTTMTYPSNLGNGSTETISFEVKNDGIAPIYLNHNVTYVRLALLDSTGAVLAVSEPLVGVNPFDWKPGQSTSVIADFAFPQTADAVSLAIGVFSNAESTEPDIKLGNLGLLPSNWLPINGTPQP